jgi:predicted RNase H-like HicB family nuclease
MFRNIYYKIYRQFREPLMPHQIKAKYGIPDKINYKLRLTEDGWFVVTSPDYPGLITQGRNGPEILDMVNDAVLTYFNVPRKEGDVVFNMMEIDGHGQIVYKDVKQIA